MTHVPPLLLYKVIRLYILPDSLLYISVLSSSSHIITFVIPIITTLVIEIIEDKHHISLHLLQNPHIAMHKLICKSEKYYHQSVRVFFGEGIFQPFFTSLLLKFNIHFRQETFQFSYHSNKSLSSLNSRYTFCFLVKLEFDNKRFRVYQYSKGWGQCVIHDT